MPMYNALEYMYPRGKTVYNCLLQCTGARELFLQLGLDSLHVDVRSDPVLSGHLGAVLCQSQILGHDSVNVDGLDTCLLEGLCESGDFGGVVELGSVGETTGPGEDGGDRVGRSFLALLVFSVVSGDRSCERGKHRQKLDLLKKTYRELPRTPWSFRQE